MVNIWKRKIKNVKEVSEKTGIDEEKIKELKEGKREIRGETMEKVLKAVNDIEKETKLEKQVKEKEIMDWCYSTNIMKLIKEFGYTGQTEVSKHIDIPQSSISNIVNKKYTEYCPNMKKVYDFFHDDFNKKVETDDEIIKWFEKHDIKKIIEDYNLGSQVQVAKKIGIKTSTLTMMLSRGVPKVITGNIRKVYEYFNQTLKTGTKALMLKEEKTEKRKYNKKLVDKEILDWYDSVDIHDLMKEYNIKSYGQLGKMLNVSKSSAMLLAKKQIPKSSAMIIPLYQFFKGLEETTQKISFDEPKEEESVIASPEEETDVNEAKKDELEDVKKEEEPKTNKTTKKLLKKKVKNLTTRLNKQLNNNKKLLYIILEKNTQIDAMKKQIDRYEKLIDRLK